MKSRNVLAAAVAAVLLCGAPLAAQAQQAPIKVVLKNVPALPGATGDAVGTVDGDPQQKAAIPLVGTEANLDSHGNIVVECLTTGGDCPNIGSGSGGAIAGVPTLSFTVPSSAVAANDTSTRLQWSTGTSADACYGVKVEKKGTTGAWEAYTPPTGSTWSKEWPPQGTASTGYVLGNLGRSATAGVDTEYRFTLRCYSKTVNDAGGTDVVAINESASATVTLASSAGTPPVGGSDYCSEYYPAGHAARSAPGFSIPTNILQPVVVPFSTVFAGGVNGDGDPVSLLDVINNNTTGKGAFAGPHAGPGKYMAIPIDIPANIPAGTGIWLGLTEPQTFQGMSPSTKMEISISPCQGDFRAWVFNNASSDYYDRAQCRVNMTGGLTATTGDLSGPGNYCFLKPGARMYINVTNHSLDAYRSSASSQSPAAPVWGCDAGVTNCGKKANLQRRTGG